ncbi:MAG TPA: phosphoribosylanthranilate isomerase [Acidimicrobiia bacterium]|nr:phosphoribosylanthranilate isomerase [Acidimicrobiia bacterium]
MSLFVKLCGIRSQAELESAVEAGADAVGLVLTPSPRQVSLSQAGILMGLLPGHVLGVAVFHEPSIELIRRVEAEVRPDLFQADLGSLRSVAPDRVLPVVVDDDNVEDSLQRALDATTREMALVDSAAKGGTGRAADWARLAGLARRDRMILAGGLSPANVGEAVSRVRPLGVDVSSGIESRPGVKNPQLMTAFVRAARAGAESRGEMLR